MNKNKSFSYARGCGDKILAMLRKGPVTSADLYMTFEREYSIHTIKSTMARLAEVHNIKKVPIKRSSSGLTQFRFELLPPKKIQIR